MANTIEQNLQQLIGALVLQVAALQTKVQDLEDQLKQCQPSTAP